MRIRAFCARSLAGNDGLPTHAVCQRLGSDLRDSETGEEVLAAAQHILSELGIELHPQKTRIVHVRHGFECLVPYDLRVDTNGEEFVMLHELVPERC